MNIELMVLNDGGVLLVGSKPFPYLVKRVEYYNQQRLFMLVYNDEDQDDELMHYEVPEHMAHPVEKSPNVVIYSLFPDHEPIGYKVPLVKVGDIY